MYAKERHCCRLAIAFSFLSIGEKGPHQTLKFAHKGKTICCKTIQSSPDSVVKAFADLDQTDFPSNTMIEAQSQNTINNYNRRWRIFSAKQLDATKLPPTRDALLQTVSRAHYQTMIWYLIMLPIHISLARRCMVRRKKMK